MNTDSQSFINGLVFGFDVGTGSIGYAVRRGKEFLDVGVLICDSEGSDLSGRRGLRLCHFADSGVALACRAWVYRSDWNCTCAKGWELCFG